MWDVFARNELEIYDIYMILYSVRYIYIKYGASFVELKNMYHQI